MLSKLYSLAIGIMMSLVASKYDFNVFSVQSCFLASEGKMLC